MPWIGSLALTLALLPHPDAVERLAPDFYGAVGFHVRAEWALTPINATESRLTLTIRGALNPGELVAPDLANLPAWADLAPRLQVIPDGSPTPGVFRWRLRRKSPGPLTIPELAYRYYRPGAPAGRHFRDTYAESQPLSAVGTEKPPESPRGVVRPRIGLPRWAWLAALPAAWVGCAVVARRGVNSDPLVEAILAELDTRSGADPAGASADALRAALALRLGARAANLSPGELPSGAVAGVLADCDASRFGARPAVDLPRRATDAVRDLARGLW